MESKNIKKTKRGKLLSSKTKLLEESKNSLAKLWRIILKDLDINEEKWNILMNIYLTDPMIGLIANDGSIGDKRGNLNKALVSNKIQMLNFNRALRFLRVERAIYKFTIYPRDLKTFPVKTYSMNILYDNNKGVQLERSLKEDLDSAKEKHGKRRFVNTFRKQQIDSVTKKYSGDFTLEQWLEDPNKKSNLATGMLSKIWRIILTDRKMDKDTWRTLTNKYLRLKDPECEIITGKETPAELKAKSKRKSNIKGNITDELQRPSFTIDVFMKGMIFLEIKKLDIEIQLKRTDNDTITKHTLLNWNPKISIEKI